MTVKSSAMTVATTIRLPKKLVARADRLAKELAVSRSAVLRLSLLEGFKVLEERYR